MANRRLSDDTRNLARCATCAVMAEAECRSGADGNTVCAACGMPMVEALDSHVRSDNPANPDVIDTLGELIGEIRATGTAPRMGNGSAAGSFVGDPIMKSPGGTTTISGQPLAKTMRSHRRMQLRPPDEYQFNENPIGSVETPRQDRRDGKKD